MAGLKANLRQAGLILKGAYYSAYKLRSGVTMSLGQLIEERADAEPHRTMLRFEDRRWSYGEMDARLNQIASAFASLGGKD